MDRFNFIDIKIGLGILNASKLKKKKLETGPQFFYIPIPTSFN